MAAAGEVADAPISTVRSLLAALGDVPAGRILPVLYKRSLSNAADMAQLVNFVARVASDTTGTAFQVLKEVLTSEDVMLAAFKASDDYGDEVFTVLQHISANPNFGGLPAAHRITKLLAEVPGNARQFFQSLSAAELKTAMEHVDVVLQAGKMDAAMVQKLLEFDVMFSASYTRMRFLEDLRVVSNADGLQSLARHILNPVQNFQVGRLYELQAAAKRVRDTGANSVQFVSKYVKNDEGVTDFDFIIDGVYYQAKSGWTGENYSRTVTWIGKAKADGATETKYVAPGGWDAMPEDVRRGLLDNGLGMEDVIDFAIP